MNPLDELLAYHRPQVIVHLSLYNCNQSKALCPNDIHYRQRYWSVVKIDPYHSPI